MKRIIYLVIRLLFRLPGYILTVHKHAKKHDSFSEQERYDHVRSIANGIIEKGNVELVIKGEENIPENTGLVFMPNHQGMFDPIAIVSNQKIPVRAICKIELVDVIVVKDVIKSIDFMPMDRDNVRASVKLISEASKFVKNGGHFLIFAEGTRSRQGNKMLEMKGGSMKIAQKAKAPIVPVAFIDAFKVFEENTIKRTTVQMHYLKPIMPEEYEGMKTNDIAKLVQSRIEECIAANS